MNGIYLLMISFVLGITALAQNKINSVEEIESLPQASLENNLTKSTSTISFIASAIEVYESEGYIDIRIGISSSTTANVTIEVFQIGGTATASDYFFESPTIITFPAGSSSLEQVLTVPITYEGVNEDAETIIFSLANVSSNGLIGNNNTITVTIAETILTSVGEMNNNVTVSQNFPNPFTGNTTVNYTLTSNDEVTVEITDVTGKVMEVMNEGLKNAGSHTVNFNSSNLAAGTYYYSVSTSKGTVTKSMNVTK